MDLNFIYESQTFSLRVTIDLEPRGDAPSWGITDLRPVSMEHKILESASNHILIRITSFLHSALESTAGKKAGRRSAIPKLGAPPLENKI